MMCGYQNFRLIQKSAFCCGFFDLLNYPFAEFYMQFDFIKFLVGELVALVENAIFYGDFTDIVKLGRLQYELPVP
jgi:hypothetical protein